MRQSAIIAQDDRAVGTWFEHEVRHFVRQLGAFRETEIMIPKTESIRKEG